MIKDNIRLNGWQSWSSCGKLPRIRIPVNRYSPFGEKEVSVDSSKGGSLKPLATGWCSWYAFGVDIDEEKIVSQAKWIAENRKVAPLEYVLVDDGWAQWGDWLSSDKIKFPRGMKFVAQEIKNLGLKPGLWIAPFLVDPRSLLIKEHSNYLVRDRRGRLVDGRKVFKFGTPFFERFILDIRNPEAKRYLERVFEVLINDWGFEMLKLDFLYAQHFNPEYDGSRIPDSLFGEFLANIKNLYPQVYTIACGCPLKPAVGKVDAMRISADIIFPQLRNVPFINHWLHSRQLSQLEVNLEYRFSTRVFWNLDPDVFVCEKSTGFTRKQVYELLKLIKKARGLKFLGDDLTNLSKEQIDSFIIPLFKD
ncbi:MAG: alpha-galactosidase [bacterium]|nr:alpha-galactosidase [bacterium]